VTRSWFQPKKSLPHNGFHATTIADIAKESGAGLRLGLPDAYAQGDRFEKHLIAIYERFIDDIEDRIVAAQKRGEVLAALPRLVAYTLTALIGQMAHRRLITDDGVTAAEAADFIVSLVFKGLRPNRS
jgi:AcrR family transcriptional regulator